MADSTSLRGGLPAEKVAAAAAAREPKDRDSR